MPYRVTCWNCGGDGVIEWECTCGEDTCCCLNPTPPKCEICDGRGWYVVTELTDDNCEDAVRID